MLKCPYPNIRLCHWQARISAKNIHQTATWIQWLKWGVSGVPDFPASGMDPRHTCLKSRARCLESGPCYALLNWAPVRPGTSSWFVQFWYDHIQAEYDWQTDHSWLGEFRV